LDFHFNREALGRYGISIESAEKMIQHALGGMTVSTTVEGRERYSINVRYACCGCALEERIRFVSLAV